MPEGDAERDAVTIVKRWEKELREMPEQERYPGVFVSFEGCEASGKSTQAEMLRARLDSMKVEAIITREPGGTRLGERIRSILLDDQVGKIDAMTEALLFAADRAQQVVEVIRPALTKPRVVIADRYFDSSLAYQGVARHLGLEAVTNLNEWAVDYLEPSLTFYLEVSYSESMRRLGGEGRDRIERQPEQFHKNVRQAYETLSQVYSYRYRIIDGEESEGHIHSQVAKMVEELLARKWKW